MHYAIRSFFIVIYGGDDQELRRYQAPINMAAPFANRLFKEILAGRPVREPWFRLIAKKEPEFQRARQPTGNTSLYGKRYDPEAQAAPAIHLHPKAQVRSFQIRLLNFQQELYRGDYSVDDIFLHCAHFLLHQGIAKGKIAADCGPYYYAIVPSSHAVYTVRGDLLPEDAYRVEGVFRLPPRQQEETRIQFRPVPQPPLPEWESDRFGPVATHGKGEPQTGRVLMPQGIYEDLEQRLTFSDKIEQGGYLLGNVFRLPDSPEGEEDPDFRWVVEITDLLMAENTVSTAVNLLFTGDTWSQISRRRDRDFAERRLVGWFHTHLFPATDSFGLSGMDQDMHAWYLPKPWQIAVLMNLEKEGRTVRCYQRGSEGILVETPFEVLIS